MKYSKIKSIVSDAKRGKMFILVDDENRENEGDLIIPSSKITPNAINFMAKFGRGLICLTLCQRQADKLNLSLMSPNNISRSQTAFTVSIDAKFGVTTGISAHDRYITIKKAIKKNVSSKNKIINSCIKIVAIDISAERSMIYSLKKKKPINTKKTKVKTFIVNKGVCDFKYFKSLSEVGWICLLLPILFDTIKYE